MIKYRTNNILKEKRLETGLNQSLKACQAEVILRYKTFTKILVMSEYQPVKQLKKYMSF